MAYSPFSELFSDLDRRQLQFTVNSYIQWWIKEYTSLKDRKDIDILAFFDINNGHFSVHVDTNSSYNREEEDSRRECLEYSEEVKKFLEKSKIVDVDSIKVSETSSPWLDHIHSMVYGEMSRKNIDTVIYLAKLYKNKYEKKF